MGSKMPSDDLTPTMGYNYLLEGYDFDEQYGDGVVDGARLPEAYGLGGLPDGIVDADDKLAIPEGVERTEEEGFDLTSTDLVADSGLPQPEYQEDEAHTDSVPDVTDFSWLEDAEQDPNRLPSLATNRVIPELVEAWGKRTDGIRRIEAVDRDAAPTETKVSDADLRRVLASAMRKSASGVSVAQIKEEVVQALGHEAARLAKPMKALENEHGLVGNVYLRPSAFPGLLRGKWAKEIKKNYKTARYLIACGQCTACKGGNSSECACNALLGLKVVTAVDWNQAYAHYAPRLEATGRLDRMATVMDKRLALQQAFLRHERNVVPVTRQQFPKDVVPEPEISPEEARRAFAETGPAKREVVDPAKLAAKHQSKKVQAKIGQWVNARLLTEGEARTLLESGGHPDAMLKKAARIITARKESGVYRGDGRLPPMATAKEAFEAMRGQGAELQKRVASQQVPEPEGENVRQVTQMMRWARRQMTEGFAGKGLTDLLRGKFSPRLLSAASKQLTQIRKKHEGLSGRVYVDAAAYASSSGTKGCEEGALIHRANALPTVLAMSRCSSCVSRSQLEDGTMRCQKYNKMLVDAPPVENPLVYQAEQIRLADASDAEITASIFSPSEFDLCNDNLEGFDIDEGPPLSKLSEYTFGGMEWNDE